MIKDTNTKATPLGGIHLIHKRLILDNTIQFIDNELGKRVSGTKYNYSDILLSRIYTAFCGGKGNATEDVNYIRENTLKNLKKISIPSADTILRGDIELASPCEFIETDRERENKKRKSEINVYLYFKVDTFQLIQVGTFRLI